MTDLTAAPGLTYEGAWLCTLGEEPWAPVDTGQLHPKTGEPTTIGTLIAEYGTALRSSPPRRRPRPGLPRTPPPTRSPPRERSAGPATRQRGGDGPAVARRSSPPSPGTASTTATASAASAPSASSSAATSPTQNDLTFGEAAVVIETLDGFTGDDAADRFREHLNKLLDAAKQPAHA
ncbi:AAA family ATPase [Streptomyces californicus]